MADDEAKKFEAGDETVFTIFTGPLKDNKGKDRVKDGVAMTGEEILTMNWFVEGVEGDIPG
jgi:basic membrane protein A